MRILTSDLYIDCNYLIQEANELYNILKQTTKYKELHKDDLNYMESMNNYINKYKNFKEKQIKQYIEDMNEYINIES